MIELRNVHKRFGRTTVLSGISLAVAEGSFTSLLGPSGCGKSTTLRIMAGLEAPTSGEVLIGGRDVAELGPAERNVAMVFQSYALYPHLTVAQNIELPLAMRRLTRVERLPGVGRLLPSARRKREENAAKVRETAEMLGLADLLERKPAQLSGGQKQRAALGRALVRDPSVFLLDEPLSNLDARLRVQMRAELTDLHRRTGVAFVYVTHDQAEAMAMSDRVAVFLGGRIAQEGTPRELYERPATRDVAAFVGTHPINFVPLRVAGGRLSPPLAAFAAEGAGDGDALLAIRPEHLFPAADGPLAARLETVEYLGAGVLLGLALGATRLVAEAAGEFVPPPPGATVRLAFDPARAHLFDAATGRRLAARVVRAGEPRAALA